MLETLETLCSLAGVSGTEDEVRDYILERVMPRADILRTDPLGNLLVHRKGACEASRTILIEAHMDEVGLIVTDITDDGLLRFGTVGGIDRRVLPGKRVFVGKARIPGVIGLMAVHMTHGDEERKLPPLEEMSIDIGAKDAVSARAAVRLGDTVSFDPGVVRFGDGYLKAKAIDDRTGCACMIKLLESELPCGCWFAFTVQEEVGCRGARVAVRDIEPDIALVLEGTTAADLPGVEGAARVCRAGGGVVIPFMDRSTIYDRELCGTLIRLAEEHGISWQTKTRIAGGTDAQVIQRSLGGVRTAALSVAVRNIHSPAGVAKISECEDQLRLAGLFLEAMAKQ